MGKNSSRAKALIEDLKDYNPRLLKELKHPQASLEKFLDDVEERERETLEILKRDIPEGLDEQEYARELNWRRQQAQELANEEINSLLRG